MQEKVDVVVIGRAYPEVHDPAMPQIPAKSEISMSVMAFSKATQTSASDEDRAPELMPTPDHGLQTDSTPEVIIKAAPASTQNLNEGHAPELTASFSVRKTQKPGEAVRRRKALSFKNMGTNLSVSGPASASTHSKQKVPKCQFKDKAVDIVLIGTSAEHPPALEALSRSHVGFPKISTKDLPRPFPYSQTAFRGPHNNKASTSTDPPVAIFRYTRNLAGITGVVRPPRQESLGLPPSGLGEGVDSYLDAHGYDADSRLHIVHAWRELNGFQDFIVYLCGKGMVQSEAAWLWQLLLDNCY